MGLKRRLWVLQVASGHSVGRQSYGRKIQRCQMRVQLGNECCKFRHYKNLQGIHWNAFWGLQRTLRQALGRPGGRCKQVVSAYRAVEDSAGVLQTHSWCLTSSGRSGRWLGEALPLLWGIVASAAPDGLFPVQPSAPYTGIIWGVLARERWSGGE